MVQTGDPPQTTIHELSRDVVLVMPNQAVTKSSATLWRHVTPLEARGVLESTLPVDLSLSRSGPVASTPCGALSKPLRSPEGSENASEETETWW